MYRIYFLLVLLVGFSALAGNPVVDSLKTRVAQTVEPREALLLYRAIGTEFMQGQVYLDSSLYYYHKAFSIADKNGIHKEQAQTLFYIARSYGISGKWDKTIEYFEKSMEYSEKFKKYNGWTAANNNLGKVYIELNQLEKAKTTFLRSIEFSDKHGIDQSKTGAYTNLADIYLRQGNYKMSREYAEKSKELNARFGRVSHWVHYVSARLHVVVGNNMEAKEEALYALKIAEKKGDLEYTYRLSLLLSEINKTNKNYREAVLYSEKAVIFNDSIVNSREKNEIEKMEMQIKLKEQDLMVKALAQKNRYLYIIYGISTIGIVLLVMLIFRQLKMIKMTKNMHHIQNLLIKTELDKRKAT